MNSDAFQNDEAVVHKYLEELAICDELNACSLPSGELIWWRSVLARKRELARRSMLAIETVRIVSVVISVTFVVLATFVWAPRLFGNFPLPLPLTIASLVLFGSSTGGVLLAWSRLR
jgi:hypothetical protein